MIEHVKPSDTNVVEKINQIIDAVNVLLLAAKPKTLNEAGEVVPAKDTP